MNLISKTMVATLGVALAATQLSAVSIVPQPSVLR